jgi:RNase P subunit RPR2
VPNFARHRKIPYFEQVGSSQIRATKAPLEGPTVGRRGIKEYRAPEALILIAADRDQRPLVCPSCGSIAVHRFPERSSSEDAPGGRVTLNCTACNRTAAYIPRTLSRSSLPESPRPSHSS